MNIYYDVEDDCYRTYPDGDIATIDQMKELIENKNLSILKLQQENKHLDEVNCKLRKTNEHLRTRIRVRESACDRLAGNWNLLKRYCYKIENDENTKLNGLDVLNKMRELEKGSDSK